MVDKFLGEALDTSAGRAFVWQQLSRCLINQLSFTGEWGSTAFNEGHRNVGNQLLADVMRVRPGAYALMLKENDA